jgi:hypothetical protein
MGINFSPSGDAQCRASSVRIMLVEVMPAPASSMRRRATSSANLLIEPPASATTWTRAALIEGCQCRVDGADVARIAPREYAARIQRVVVGDTGDDQILTAGGL